MQDPAHHLRVVLPFASADDFVLQYAGCITEGGIYVPVEPLPIRTRVHLEVQLLTGEPVLRASGVVSFVTAPGKRGHPGMGVRFTSLDEPSRVVVQRACAGRVTDPQLPPLPNCIELAAGEAAPQFETPAPSAALPHRPATATSLAATPPKPETATPLPWADRPRPAASMLRSATVPKAPVRLKIRIPAQASFATKVESLALTFTTRQPLPLWTQLELEVAGPEEGAPWHARGEVISVSGKLLTVRLADAPASAIKGLRKLGAASVPGVQVDVRIALLLLSDEMLADAGAELLCAEGIAAFDGIPEGLLPDVIAADAAHLTAASKRFPQARLVAVNLSGPDALIGDASRLKPRVFLKKPVSAIGLVNAIVSELHPSPPSGPTSRGSA
jgi:uncharacterized protein (TIGR02266 family)